MRILLDTNILIDYISKRELFFDDANKIITLCANEKINGCIAAHSVMDALYIIRKEYSLEERRRILTKLIMIVDIIGIDKHNILTALNNESFTDIEDCLQMECAKEYKADYIVTRNIQDFKNSPIQPILPSEFIKLI